MVEQLKIIKRAPHEFMSDFNYRFQKTWDRIHILVKPCPEYAFLYFLRALHTDIVVMIHPMGDYTFLGAYDVSIREKNCLIQDGKIAPRTPMPLFLDLPS